MSDIHSSEPPLKLLIISGSLRKASSTHQVIANIIAMVPSHVKALVYDGLGSLPHFDDCPEPQSSVMAFREAVRLADGIIICTPEYAFGAPGSLKNALDWTVSSGDFVNKPVALITAATGGENAHRSLLLTLSAISCHLPPQAQVLISFVRSKLNEAGEITDESTQRLLRKAVDALIEAIVRLRQEEEN